MFWMDRQIHEIARVWWTETDSDGRVTLSTVSYLPKGWTFILKPISRPTQGQLEIQCHFKNVNPSKIESSSLVTLQYPR